MRTFVISGAGSGIGRASALSLASQNPGSKFYLIGRRKEALEQTRSLLGSDSQTHLLSCDLKSREQTCNVIGEALKNEDHLSGVLANAGIGGENRFNDGEDRWQEILDINLSGTYYMVNSCLTALKKSSSTFRHVAIVSSILARLGVPNYSAYCASKSGLLGLMRSWASEWSSEKILVNAIAPGWVETDMARDGLQQMAKNRNMSYEEVYKEQMGFVPLGRMSSPEEIGELVSYLFGKNQNSITGQTLDINNGALMPS